nr:hypothetical protein [Campylobacter jejuni]
MKVVKEFAKHIKNGILGLIDTRGLHRKDKTLWSIVLSHKV